jgi:CHAT domain-containing protein/tetratricopeptide (TPR) repeat protein
MTCWRYFFSRNSLSFKSLCHLVYVTAVFLPVASTQAQQPTTLQHGLSLTREINPQEPHSFEFELQFNQLITLEIFAEDFNFALRLMAPDGNTLEEVVHRRYGQMTWKFVAPGRGRYRLLMSSLELDAQPRKYQLKVEQIRTATQYEKHMAQAAADFHEAEVLRFKWHSSDLLRALEKYQAAGIAWREQAQWTEAAGAWQRLGEVHFLQGDYDKAMHAYEVALGLSQRTNDVFLSLTQLNNITYVHIYLGNIEKAFTLCRQIQRKLDEVSVGQNSTRKLIEAQLQNNFGEAEYGRGNLKDSINYFARALELWKEVGDRQGMALAHLNAGYSYLDLGSVNEATPEFEQALQLSRAINDWRGEALSLTAQGNLYALLGNKYTALVAHRQAREIFRQIGDRQGEAITSNGLGDVFEDLNLKQEAIDNYSHALQLNQAIGNKDFVAVGRYYLGRVYRDLGDFPRSISEYEASLALSRQTGKSRMAALAQMDMAGIYTKQQKYADALRLYQQSMAFYQQIGDLRRQALCQHGLGELLRVREEREAALGAYRQGLKLFQQIKDPQGEAESRYWLAKLLQEQGRLPEALTESRESINLIEIQRALVPGQSWRSTYFASVRRHFELYVDILMQLHWQQPERGFAALALQASERTRARSLLELLAETQGEIRQGVDPALLTRERQLRQQLSAKAGYQIRVLNSARPEAEVSAIELEIRNLNNEYNFVQAQINAQSPTYAQLNQQSILTLAEIQATLKEDENTVLLEYILGDERSYLWLVTANTLIVQELPGRRVLDNLSGDVYQALTARQLQPIEDMSGYLERYAAAEEQFCPRATQLSQLVLGPLKSVPNPQRLLVVADGNLQYIPFDALPWPAAKVCQLGAEPPTYIPLLKTAEVIHLPSFSSLALLRRLEFTSRRVQGIAVWADPVFEADDPRIIAPQLSVNAVRPLAQKKADLGTLEARQIKYLVEPEDNLTAPRLLATQEEAQSIMQFAPAGAAMLLTGFAANRESVLERDLSGFRILHFATHGLVNHRHPSLSGLLLSTVDENGHGRNGLLQLPDIYGLRLNADLVVLSACQTGLGEELSGEGIVGLTQGFMYAGSRSIVVSLWPVEDKTTAVLMTNFYQAMLKEGVAPAAALRRAKLMMYQQRVGQSPYYWSAFIIQGEFRPKSPTWHDWLKSSTLWSGLIAVAFMFWAIHVWWKRRRLHHRQPLR